MTSSPPPAHPALAAEFGDGELEITGRLMQASNATFLTTLTRGETQLQAVYKPIQGERPLWDFPEGTLGLREVAAYETSKLGGFDVVPVTVLADGPLGTGSLQAWVEAGDDETSALVDLVDERTLPLPGWFDVIDGFDPRDRPVAVVHRDDPRLRRLAVFDAVINNADRKGGHILGSAGHVFGVDHGVSFHTDPKLRTLLWGWAGDELTDDDRSLVQATLDGLPGPLLELLAPPEVDALYARCTRLLRAGVLPRPRGHAIPWPPF